MWVSYEKHTGKDQPLNVALINLDKVTAITINGNCIQFLGEIIQKGQKDVNGQVMDIFGTCILDDVPFATVEDAQAAFNEITSAILNGKNGVTTMFNHIEDRAKHNKALMEALRDIQRPPSTY